jgi:hypothetical protein
MSPITSYDARQRSALRELAAGVRQGAAAQRAVAGADR